VIDNRDPITKLISLVHVMRGHQHRNPLPMQPAHQFPHRQSALRIESRCWFVEKKHARPVRNSARNLQSLRHAARKRPGHCLGSLSQLELFQQLLRALASFTCVHSEITAVVVNVLESRARAVQRVLLGHHADELPRTRRISLYVDAINRDLPLRGTDPRRACADRRRFARPIRTEQSENLSVDNVEINPIDRADLLLSLEDLYQTTNLDCWIRKFPHNQCTSVNVNSHLHFVKLEYPQV
jgi:hypothetical protein